MKNKKAVSPVIATVLLIMIVIILAIIILLWSRGFVKEAITKTIGDETKTVEQWCSEVQIDRIISEDETSFGFQNIGNIPIYKFNLKLTESGSGDSSIENYDVAVNPGFSTLVEDKSYSDYEQIKVIPIILGKKKSGGQEPFECPENDNLII